MSIPRGLQVGLSWDLANPEWWGVWACWILCFSSGQDGMELLQARFPGM